MSAAERFTVMTTGSIEPGFDQDQVAADFGGLLHMTGEMAESFVTTAQCVATNLEKPRAVAYQQSLMEIGLPVVLVPANDPSAKPANEETRKLAEANYSVDIKTEEELAFEARQARNKKRTIRFTVLGVAAVALAGVLLFTKAPSVATSQFVTLETFNPEPRAGEQIEKLMAVSGLNDDFANFSSGMHDAHVEYFSQVKRQSPTLTDKKYDDLMQLVPRTYNESGLKNSMGNHLQQSTFESDVIDLIKLFETPAASQYVALSKQRNPDSDPQGFEQFKASLVDTPLTNRRVNALTLVVDAMGLDDAAFEVTTDIHRNLIATTGALRPDRQTTAAKVRITAEIKAMRLAAASMKPQIREEVITVLAWQYADQSDNELYELRDVMNRYIARNFIRDMSEGFENYLHTSTLWLHRNLDHR